MTSVLATQTVDVVDAHFQERRRQVPVLAQRAEAEGIAAIREAAQIVPLLLPHTAYKSYPEALIARGHWAQMNRWLDSLSTYRVADVDVSGVADVDDWVDRLAGAGHLVASSSGTSGKSSFLNKTSRDRAGSLEDMVRCFTVMTGFPAAPEWHIIPVGPDTGVSHHHAVRDAIVAAFARPDAVPFPPAAPAIGHHRYMSQLAAMRRAMADGTARPDEVAEFEAQALQRQADLEQRLRYFAQHVLERRSERLLFSATLPLLFRFCGILKELGVTEDDVSAENALITGGGLKGQELPPDYLQQIFRMLNITPGRFLHYYSMQELNLRLPKCGEGRYHVPSEIALFVLDKEGERFAPISDGQVEGRAAFCDTTIDGRWGGTISGDKILADLRGCPCGRPGTTVFDQITRYTDLPDGDKLTCAGTIDAYVRGFIGE